jgi:hypothetical protein
MNNSQSNSLDYLGTLSKSQILSRVKDLTGNELESIAQQAAIEEVRLASLDLHYYLEHFVVTQDEHDQEKPFKKLPYEEKQYLRDLANLFLIEPLLLIEKSRQMMVTWLMIACHLWDAQFHEGRRIFFQSKKEVDANALIDRAKFIYNNYPQPYREIIHTAYPARQPMAFLRLEFSKQKSIIQGTPQGADVLRQYTASRIFSDEMAFQDQAEEAYIAAKPTIVGGGRFIGCSSPNFKNFFWRIAKDVVL